MTGSPPREEMPYLPLTYAPPEYQLHVRISQAFDIWMLGCVYLEFISWLVLGWRGVVQFHDVREHITSSGVSDDTFFIVTDDGNDAIIKESVLSWIHQLHELLSGSPFVQDFLELVSKRMLVVSAPSRIKSSQLKIHLQEMLNKADADPSYLSIPVQDQKLLVKRTLPDEFPENTGSHLSGPGLFSDYSREVV